MFLIHTNDFVICEKKKLFFVIPSRQKPIYCRIEYYKLNKKGNTHVAAKREYYENFTNVKKSSDDIWSSDARKKNTPVCARRDRYNTHRMELLLFALYGGARAKKSSRQLLQTACTIMTIWSCIVRSLNSPVKKNITVIKISFKTSYFFVQQPKSVVIRAISSKREVHVNMKNIHHL